MLALARLGRQGKETIPEFLGDLRIAAEGKWLSIAVSEHHDNLTGRLVVTAFPRADLDDVEFVLWQCILPRQRSDGEPTVLLLCGGE